MVSYARARAESLIPLCKVDSWSGRAAGAADHRGMFNRMAQVLWVIAVISTITVIHRIFIRGRRRGRGGCCRGLRVREQWPVAATVAVK